MRTRLLLFAGAIVLATLCTSAMAGGEVNLFYGQKNMDFGIDLSGAPSDARSAINDLEKQDEWGVLFTWGHDWPVALAVDVLFSSQDETLSYTYVPQTYGVGYTYNLKVEVETREIDLGVRKYFLEKVQVYVGGGLAYINGDVKFSIPGTSLSASEDDNGIGFFLNAGVVWRAGKWFNLGADLRWSDASGDFPDTFDQSVDLGGTHYGIFVGGRW